MRPIHEIIRAPEVSARDFEAKPNGNRAHIRAMVERQRAKQRHAERGMLQRLIDWIRED